MRLIYNFTLKLSEIIYNIENTKDEMLEANPNFRISMMIYQGMLLLLLLLSRFSRVRLCATPETAPHQAPPTLGVSRQEHWSGLPFPSPMHESEK